MKNPKISIIIPSYNYETFIEEAINSVIGQTFKDFELIIVDDGSSDNSVEVIKKYVQQYENISLFIHENNENKGLSETIQLGLQNAKGEYIAFLECDDFWHEDYLKEKIAIFEDHPDVGIVFNDVEALGDENRINLLKDFFNDCRTRCINKTYPSSLSYETLMLETISNFSSAMTKKSILQDLDFDTPIAPYLDWWLFSQITFLHSAYFINKKLTNLRLHTKSYIVNTRNKITIQDKKNMFKSLLELLELLSVGTKYNDLTSKILAEKSNKSHSDEIHKNDFMEKFKGKNVFLYGAGSFLSETLGQYDFSNLNIKGIIDADKNKIGQKILGYEIYHKDNLLEIKPDVILISTQEPELVYSDLRKFVLDKGLDIPIITDYFNDVRFKALTNKDLSLEEVLTELF